MPLMKPGLPAPASIAVDANGQKDADDCFVEVLGYEQTEQNGLTVHTWRTHSNLWKKKEYVLEVGENAARFYARVEGKGNIDALRFFMGQAGFEHAGYMLPECNAGDYYRNLRVSKEPAALTIAASAPPCYVYPFYMHDCDGWMGVGLAARAGQYNFDQFLYQQANGYCGFELPLNGQITVDGVWESQSLLFLPGKDGFDVVRAYSDWHYDNGWCIKRNRSNDPAWWKRPLFCTWGEQQTLSRKFGGETRDYATQARLQDMMDKLDEMQLDPGTIILDSRWQKN